jgi:cysteinyl-tRNA synthetase
VRPTSDDGSGPHLFNSMGRRMQEFVPKDPSLVKVFTCGPSVYRPPHMGNYRTFLFEDVLVRYLRYKGYGVRRAMNITDLEDRSVIESFEQHVDINALTRRNESVLLTNFKNLNIELPDRMPRSSRSIVRSVQIVKALLKKGIAYRHGPDVFYDPLKFPGFGRLYGLDMSRWPRTKRRFKKDTYPGMRWNLGDFILWHGCRSGADVCYDAELGPGRPSWNVQDAAMVMDTLGGSVDIWCGGKDNLIRHHDYNIAVAEAYTDKELAPYWLHAGHLLLDGKKMSKSRGNVAYPQDIAAKGYSWRAMRFYLLNHQWNEPMDLSLPGIEEASERLESLTAMISRLKGGGRGSSKADSIIPTISAKFNRKMDDNLDVGGAVDLMERTLTELDGEGLSSLQKGEILGSLKKADGVLKVLF